MGPVSSSVQLVNASTRDGNVTEDLIVGTNQMRQIAVSPKRSSQSGRFSFQLVVYLIISIWILISFRSQL